MVKENINLMVKLIIIFAIFLTIVLTFISLSITSDKLGNLSVMHGIFLSLMSFLGLRGG